MLAERKEMLSGFGLHKKEAEDLQLAGKLVIPSLPEILNGLFDGEAEKLTAFRCTASTYRLGKAKSAQQEHWEMLLSGEFDEEYFSSAAQLGHSHRNAGLTPGFLSSAYAKAVSRSQRLILAQEGRSADAERLERLSALTAALSHALSLDLHLVSDAHRAADLEEQEIGLSYLSEAMGRVAAGDLTQSIPSARESNFPERYNSIRASFNSMLGEMRTALADIQSAAAALDSKTEEAAKLGEDLYLQNETQVEALTQTAAAVKLLTSNLESTADVTAKGSKRAISIGAMARRSCKKTQMAGLKLNEAKNTWQQIAELADGIEDRLLQAGPDLHENGEASEHPEHTEEAKAVGPFSFTGGDTAPQGEVRASSEPRDLVSLGSDQLEASIKLFGSAECTLAQMAIDIRLTSELTSDIAYLSREQSEFLSRINAGVAGLDEFSQQSAELVVDAATTLLAIQDDIDTLTKLTGSFQLGGAAPRSGGPSSGNSGPGRNPLRLVSD